MKVAAFWRDLDNFGDRHLNSFLLNKLFPKLLPYGSPSDCLLFGIGTLFGNRALRKSLDGKRRLPRLVFSSGAYPHTRATLPTNSEVVCVRGTRTCRILGIDERYAVADAALLLPDYLPLTPTASHDTATVHKCEWWGTESETSFSTRVTDFTAFVERLLSFRHVQTHSLHAAIIADAYGVPWKPLRWEPKWADHFEQVGIKGRPQRFTLSSRSALSERTQQLRELVERVNKAGWLT